jgi:hypothetical protein
MRAEEGMSRILLTAFFAGVLLTATIGAIVNPVISFNVALLLVFFGGAGVMFLRWSFIPDKKP